MLRTVNVAGIATGFMPVAVSTSAHPDRVKHIYRKAIKEITAAAGPSGASIIDTLDQHLIPLTRVMKP